jgi:hypothetical protein
VRSVEVAKARVAEIITGEQQTIKHLKAEWRMALGLLHYSEFRHLTRPEIVQAICEAMTENKAEFFKAMGQRLSDPPEPLSSRLVESNISKFTLFVILNWMRFDVLPLCLLTIPGLLTVSTFCGLQPPDEISTRKMIERLGLHRPMRVSRLRVSLGEGRLIVRAMPSR